MNEIIPYVCPTCGINIEPNYNFCPHCGKSVKELFKGVEIIQQMYIYFVSIFFPPLGLVWTFRYSKYPLRNVRLVGLVALILTLFSLITSTIIIYQLFHQIQTSASNFDTLYNSIGL